MVNPYLVFHGQCGEALKFYQSVFGGEDARTLPYGEYVPEGLDTPPEGLREWVMHAEMEICGTKFWLADEAMPVRAGNTVRLTVTLPTVGECGRVFEALCAGGTVTLPPTETFYSTFHGAVVDRFGVGWNITAEEAPKRPE